MLISVRRNALVGLILACSVTACSTVQPGQAAAEDLLAADARLGATGGLLSEAFGPMLAADVVMPDGRNGFAEGADALLQALQRDTALAGARAAWTPVRAAMSADGTHGMTLGFLDLTTTDGSIRGYKYLSYWIRDENGWRVAVWRRMPRAPGEVDRRPLPPDLPTSTRAALPAEDHAQAVAELAAVEQAFSDSAQVIGIGPAFARFGAPDAIHLGAPSDAELTRGRDAIVAIVSDGVEPGSSPVHWSATHSIVAPSGDFGVNLGFIVPNDPSRADVRIPFFTVWRRGPAGWRYIAE